MPIIQIQNDDLLVGLWLNNQTHDNTFAPGRNNQGLKQIACVVVGSLLEVDDAHTGRNLVCAITSFWQGRSTQPKEYRMFPSSMTQKTFRAQVGNDAVLWIRPSSVTGDRGTKWPVSKARLAKAEIFVPKALVNILRPAVKNREPFIQPSS